MKNKMSKLIVTSFCTTIVGLVPLVIGIGCNYNGDVQLTTNKNNFQDQKNDNAGLVFDGKYFKNIDEAASYFINKNIDSVSDDFYLGDLNKALADASTGLVNVDNLYPYQRDRLRPVYLNALNQPTPSYQDAKKNICEPWFN